MKGWSEEQRDALVGALVTVIEATLKGDDDYIGCSLLLDTENDEAVLSVRFERGVLAASFTTSGKATKAQVDALMESMGGALESMDFDVEEEDDGR